ncbi:hypothetical protein BZY95_20350 [Billgrantia desiderata SP1]|nr:hypothetical protein BZY95_20350 [Halomonas desiderata SP1]
MLDCLIRVWWDDVYWDDYFTIYRLKPTASQFGDPVSKHVVEEGGVGLYVLLIWFLGTPEQTTFLKVRVRLSTSKVQEEDQ